MYTGVEENGGMDRRVSYRLATVNSDRNPGRIFELVNKNLGFIPKKRTVIIKILKSSNLQRITKESLISLSDNPKEFYKDSYFR